MPESRRPRRGAKRRRAPAGSRAAKAPAVKTRAGTRPRAASKAKTSGRAATGHTRGRKKTAAPKRKPARRAGSAAPAATTPRGARRRTAPTVKAPGRASGKRTGAKRAPAPKIAASTPKPAVETAAGVTPPPAARTAPRPGAPAATRTVGPGPAAPAPAAPDEPLPKIPAPGGPARAVLMLVHPRLLFLYWVLDAEAGAALQRSSGPAELRLEVSADGRSFREADRHPFDFRAPSWYLPCSTIDCLTRARLGTVDGGAFREILISNAVRVPRESAGSDPEVWMQLDELRRGRAPRSTLHPRRAGVAVTGAAAPRRAPPTSPGSGHIWEPGRRPGSRHEPEQAGGGGAILGDLCLVLHSHLPFVRHPERRFFLEEQWLFEAITETYLPILDMLEHLQEDGEPARVTVTLTPTLMAMLRDPLLAEKYARHLQSLCALAAREVERTRRDGAFGPVAGFYRDRLERYRYLFESRYGRDLVAQYARLEEQGRIEIVGCAATHGFLPNLRPTPESVRAQIEIGVAEHRRQIGRAPRGLWLPECAYFEGLDLLLAEAGIEYFFVDAHALLNASSRPRLGLHAPLFCPAGVAAFGRDEETSVQVWSAQEGYPGDPAYRDFYRDIGFDLEHDYVRPYLDPSGLRGMTGFKYHRITGRTDHKEAYRRDWALRAVQRHADDFTANRRLQMKHLAAGMDRRPLVVAMYDAELFGHWWFEGPEWLEAVLRRLPAHGIRGVTPSQYLDEQPFGQVAEPSASSWGERGYYEVWLQGTNDWIVPPLHDAGRRMAALAARAGGAGPAERRVLSQAGRELLLAQSSDWPFILKNRTSVGYASRRALEHLARFDRLARQLEERRLDEAAVAPIEAQDNLFPELDVRAWRSA